MNARFTIFMAVANLALALAVLIFCYPVSGRYAHMLAKLFPTLAKYHNPQIDYIRGMLTTAQFDIATSSQIALLVSLSLVVNAAICFFALWAQRRNRSATPAP